MEPHGSTCGWFWAWTIAGFGLTLGFLAIFSIGPFLLPFVTLLVGISACRRADPRAIAAAVIVVVAASRPRSPCRSTPSWSHRS
jgi:4-amino-4-deoxy-L-arabinose transferase-like glycosyltransferase